MGDVAHSARKAISTARFSAPRILLPYARTPALQSRFGSDEEQPMNKLMLVTPKLLDIKNDRNYNTLVDKNPEFVGAGEIMDALGFSNPEQKQFSLRKIILHQKPLAQLAPQTIKMRSNFEDGDLALPKVDDQKYFLVSDTIDPENKVI